MCSKKYLITILSIIAFMPLFAFGQRLINGIVLSRDTNSTIPYVSVGLNKQNVGTTSDENGNFKITSWDKPDSIIFSSVGYKTIIIAVDSVLKNGRVYLFENNVELLPIVVKTSHNTVTKNQFKSCSSNYYVTSDNAVRQIAQLYQTPKKISYLQGINICNQGTKSRFRIRVYDIDTSLMIPTKDLVDSIIEVNSNKRMINVSFNNPIYIPQNYFFIAIEWLYIPENTYYTSIKFNGTKIKLRNYYPAISYRHVEKVDDFYGKSFRLWTLNFDGTWRPIARSHSEFNFLISAKILY